MRGLARFEDGLRGEEWMRVLRGAQHGARSGMEGFEERGAALRGVRVPWVPSGRGDL